MSDEDRVKFLLTEYEQSGEEYRTRHRLLHNSYYLFTVALLLFAGTAFPVSDEPIKLGILCLIGSIVFHILGMVVITHYVERGSASALRTRSEQAAEEIWNDDIDHGLEIQRPFGIQYHVVGKNFMMDSSHDLIERDSKYGVILSKPELSAKTVGQLILGLGILLGIAGLFILVSTIVFT